jgi:hypothetical protein
VSIVLFRKTIIRRCFHDLKLSNYSHLVVEYYADIFKTSKCSVL